MGALQKAPKVPPEDIVARYVAGENATELAKELKMCRKTILRILRRENVEIRTIFSPGVRRSASRTTETASVSDPSDTERPSEDTIRRLIGRYKMGDPVRDIAASAGVSQFVVYYYLRKAGVSRFRRSVAKHALRRVEHEGATPDVFIPDDVKWSTAHDHILDVDPDTLYDAAQIVDLLGGTYGNAHRCIPVMISVIDGADTNLFRNPT